MLQGTRSPQGSDNGPILTILKLQCMGKIILNTLEIIKTWSFKCSLHFIFSSLVVL